MSADQKRTITPDQRLQAFAMMTLAGQHYGECRKLERGVSNLLGGDGEWAPGTITDLLYAADNGSIITEADFDEAIRNLGFTIEPDSLAPLRDEAAAMANSLDAAEEARTDPIFNDTAALLRRLCDALARLRALVDDLNSPQSKRRDTQSAVLYEARREAAGILAEMEAGSLDVAQAEKEAEHQSELNAYKCLGLQNEIERLRGVAQSPMAYRLDHPMHGTELSICQPDDDWSARGWVVTPLYAGAPKTDWRDISTAPKDGTEIIGLFCRRYDESDPPTIYGPWTIAYDGRKWRSSWDGQEVIDYMSDFGTEYKGPDIDPTHWCRAPEPPAIAVKTDPREVKWPAGCHSPNSCDRNSRCMYVGCKHDGSDIRALADEAIAVKTEDNRNE